ncbi:MBOAT family protein [Omnitrophica bacterium]|nr:MBOAT family protein [Candidatus Omnitrophota bacterium]
MLFYQPEFIFFFASILIVLRYTRLHDFHKLFLLAASYYFYAFWDWRFSILIFASTVVDFCAALMIQQSETVRKQKLLLTLSIVFNLGLLGVFKYFNFFIESFNALLSPISFHLQTVDIILPIGISFYTFQTMSYTIDVFRKKITPTRNFIDFALFVSFFPQLVAGPIVRAADFLPQIKRRIHITRRNLYFGLRLFLIGLFKKVFLADHLGYFVDNIYGSPLLFDTATVWLAALCFSLQIYFDFSGYSDMAIGIARIMGFYFKKNFNFPYLATNLRDLWDRWHISLTTWVKDYLYRSLGGSRRSLGRNLFNVIVTMAIMGLWHGARWPFVIWGLMHAGGLLVNRMLTSFLQRWQRPPLRVRRMITITGWFLTFLYWTLASAVFRAPNVSTALDILHKLFAPSAGIFWFYPLAGLIILLTILVHLLRLSRWKKLLVLHYNQPHTPFVLFLLLWILLTVRRESLNPFIYFQF